MAMFLENRRARRTLEGSWARLSVQRSSSRLRGAPIRLQALIRATPPRGGDAKPGVSQDARRPSRQFGLDTDTEVALHMSRPDAASRRSSWARPTRLVGGTIAALVLGLAGVPAAFASAPADYIVQLRPGVGVEEGAQGVRALDGRPGRRLPLIDALGARLDRGAAARLERDPRVRAVNRNG